MNTTDRARQPKGSPAGGEFAAEPGAEATATLGGESTTANDARKAADQIVAGASLFLDEHTCGVCATVDLCADATYANSVLHLEQETGKLPGDIEAAGLADILYVAAEEAEDSYQSGQFEIAATRMALGATGLAELCDATSRDTSAERFVELASSPHVLVVASVVLNDHVPTAAVNILASRQDNSMVRLHALARRNVDPAVLRAALSDPDALVAITAAKNPTLPDEFVTELGNHPAGHARARLSTIMWDRKIRADLAARK